MCGICGTFGHKEDAAFLNFLTLYGLQHRGHEGAGMVVANKKWKVRKELGYVVDVFGEGTLFGNDFNGNVALGQTRYSTSGSSRIKTAEERERTKRNLQPFVEEGLAVVFNGNIANYVPLRKELEGQGIHFRTDVDTEVISKYLSANRKMPLDERVYEFSKRAKGAYSLGILEKTKNGNRIMLVRDPLGFRPLVLGKIGEESIVFASETCPFQITDAEYIRDVMPGEIVSIDNNGISTKGYLDRNGRLAQCIFELIYFGMPESLIFKYNAGNFKEASGRQLFAEQPAKADVVLDVPDSAKYAAKGYVQQSMLPKGDGLNRNKYSGRTFIHPSQFSRDLGVRMKFFVNQGEVKGRRIALVDDSIVRGTTTPHVIKLLRKHGAEEVHMRVASPPLKHPCMFGVDMPDKSKFAAYERSIDEICQLIRADSLGYLSLDGLLKCAPGKPEDYCTACFSGNYPYGVSDAADAQAEKILLRASS